MKDDPPPPLVLHVIHHLVVGGMENGLVNLINHMDPSRFRHAIACVEDYSDFRDRIERADVEVHALRRSYSGTWGLRAKIFRLCRRLRPTIVHSRGTSGLDAPMPARLAGVRRCIHGEHGWDVGDLHGEQLKPALRRRLHAPLITHYVAVSEHLARYLEDRVKIRPSRVTLIRNGVDTQRFSPERRDRSELPAALREPDRVVIGTVGRLQPVKDQATLVRAFARFRRTRPELAEKAALAVVGDGPLSSEIRSLAQAEGVDDAWFPGATDRVDEILPAFDVFVLPSLAEGISNTILEAMASGLPVLATNTGGNPELVIGGETGRLFEPGDVDTLAGHLVDYVSNEKLRRDHGLGARARATESFSLEGMVHAYQTLYERFATN